MSQTWGFLSPQDLPKFPKIPPPPAAQIPSFPSGTELWEFNSNSPPKKKDNWLGESRGNGMVPEMGIKGDME